MELMGMQPEIHKLRIGTHGMHSEIHWQGIGIRTKASREGIEQELKVASHSRTFREMEMSTNSSIDAEILNSGTLQKSVHII